MADMEDKSKIVKKTKKSESKTTKTGTVAGSETGSLASAKGTTILLLTLAGPIESFRKPKKVDYFHNAATAIALCNADRKMAIEITTVNRI